MYVCMCVCVCVCACVCVCVYVRACACVCEVIILFFMKKKIMTAIRSYVAKDVSECTHPNKHSPHSLKLILPEARAHDDVIFYCGGRRKSV